MGNKFYVHWSNRIEEAKSVDEVLTIANKAADLADYSISHKTEFLACIKLWCKMALSGETLEMTGFVLSMEGSL